MLFQFDTVVVQNDLVMLLTKIRCAKLDGIRQRPKNILKLIGWIVFMGRGWNNLSSCEFYNMEINKQIGLNRQFNSGHFKLVHSDVIKSALWLLRIRTWNTNLDLTDVVNI